MAFSRYAEAWHASILAQRQGVAAAAAGNKSSRLFPMNMDMAAQIYGFYMHGEPKINICRNILNAMVFNGGVTITLKMHRSDEEEDDGGGGSGGGDEDDDDDDDDAEEGKEKKGFAPQKSIGGVSAAESAQQFMVREEDEANADPSAMMSGEAPQAAGLGGGAFGAPKKPVERFNGMMAKLSKELQRREEREAKRRENEELSLVLHQDITEEFLRVSREAMDYKRMFGMVPVRVNYAEVERLFGVSHAEHVSATSASADEGADDDDDDDGGGGGGGGGAGGVTKGPDGKTLKKRRRSGGGGGGARIDRPALDFTKRKPLVEIPAFGSGRFALKYDDDTYTPRVVFVEHDGRDGSVQLGPMLTVKESKDVRVFVWPGCTPSVDGASFRSDIYPLFSRYLEVAELVANRLDADYDATHPAVFVATKREKGASAHAGDLYEDDMMANIGIVAPTSEEERVYRRSAYDKMATERLRAMVEADLPHSERARVTGGISGGGQVSSFGRRSHWHTNIIPLPEGKETQNVTVPAPQTNTEEIRRAYQEEVIQAMGIPPSFMEVRRTKTQGGSSGGGASSSSTANAALEQEYMRTSIGNVRADVADFMQFLYDELFRRIDNEVIGVLLYEIDNKRPLSDLEASFRGRIRDKTKGSSASTRQSSSLSKRRRQASSMPGNDTKGAGVTYRDVMQFLSERTRIDIRFNRDPLPYAHDIESIMLLEQQCAVSPMEAVNMLRSRFGFNRITDPAHPLILTVKAMREQRFAGTTTETLDAQQASISQAHSTMDLEKKQGDLAVAQKKAALSPDTGASKAGAQKKKK